MKVHASFSFFVNGQEKYIENCDPETTLASYLRNKLNLTGSKLACEEGVCGACTVVVAKYDVKQQKPIYCAVNACVTPLFLVENCSVLTIEGIGNISRMHAIQQRLTSGHGTQCGFCSPGFVMSLYALLRNHPLPTTRQIDEAIRGNLCRCTGYRPIIESFYSFSSECCNRNQGTCLCKMKQTTSEPGRLNSLVNFDDFPKVDPTQEIIFPPKLLISIKNRANDEILQLKGKRVTLIAPSTMIQLKEVYKQEVQNISHIITSGLMTRLVESTKADDNHQDWVSIHRISEFRGVRETDNEIFVGAGLSLTEFIEVLRSYDKRIKTSPYAEVIELFEKYSSTQVRNVASWAGSLCSKSSNSDLCSVALALEWHVVAVNVITLQERLLPITNEFFSESGTEKTILPVEFVKELRISVPDQKTKILAYKFGKRHGGDSTLVNAVAKFQVEQQENGFFVVDSAKIAFGGIKSRPWLTSKISDYLCGKQLSNAELLTEEAVDVLENELKENVNQYNSLQTTREHREGLAVAALCKMLIKLVNRSNNEDMTVFRECFTSQQDYNAISNSQSVDDPIGRPIPVQSANVYTTGEAIFTSDVRALDMLYGALVQSTQAHAKIISIDWSQALLEPGVVDYACCSDIPEGGTNQPGLDGRFVYEDVKIFADKEVEAVGQVIGIVVAETIEAARRASQKVIVKYEILSAIVSIKDAIQAKSYNKGSPFKLSREWNENEDYFKFCKYIAEGDFSIGAQEHAYMETQSAVCIPGEANEWTVYASCQRNAWLQKQVAKVLGIPKNKIVVKVKRVGGAFGGKDTQAIYAWGPALIAAYKTKRPVRCSLSRKEDMLATGTRHPAEGHYKIGCDQNGYLVAASIETYINGGYGADYSPAVADLMNFNADACYKIPHMQVQTYSCKTNIASNTAMRGFGIPQAYIIMETAIEHIAQVAGIPSNTFREINHANVGWVRLNSTVIRDDNMLDCWKHCKKLANLDELQKSVAKFNEDHKYKKRGIGMSSIRFGLTHGGPFEQAFALVQIYLDGSVSVSTGAIEMGQGLITKCLQIASRALGIPMSKITTLDSSTDKTANAPLTSGSQSADVFGNAVKVACEKLRGRLQPVIDEAPNATWEDWIWSAYTRKIPLSIGLHSKILRTENKLPETGPTYFTSGAACIVAEIDALTGEQRLCEVIVVMDCGDTLNPAVDIGQIEGGFMQGYGLTTTEEYLYTKDGQLITDSLNKYKIPTADSVPEKFHVALLKESTGNNAMVYSSKGIGEPPLILGASATITAVRHAVEAYYSSTGWSEQFLHLETPLTAEQIRKACKNALKKTDSKS